MSIHSICGVQNRTHCRSEAELLAMNMVFKITDNQISAFEKDAEERYIRDLVKFLQDEVPGAAEDDCKKLFEITKAMVKKAADYGLKTKRDAAIYVTTVYLLGLDFEEHFHVAKEILTSSLPGMDKANWLQDAAVALIDSKGR
jgi:hypothetical protein